MKKQMIPILLFIGIIFSPIFVHAHVKWFTNIIPMKQPIESILSPQFILIAVGTAIVLAVLPQVLPRFMEWSIAKKIDGRLDKFRTYSQVILKYWTALALTIQVTSGTLFAPEFPITSISMSILEWAAIILLLIPHHFATKAGALIMAGLYLYMLQHVGLFHMLDYGYYGAVIVVLMVGNTKFEKYGFPFLYLGTGLSLCWVAVEKWVYPVMSLDIVQQHSVPTFGFTPATFIVLSAFIEFVVGYLLVVGILNRLLAFVLTGIFILTTTLFGYVEVIGHFMIHGILLIFIIEGVSFYNPPIKMHKTKMDQIIFVFLNFLFVLATFLLIYYRFAA